MTEPREEIQNRGPRRAQRGKREGRRERAPADRNAVPTLLYGTHSNYTTFKKKLSLAALAQYKDLGRLFDTNEYYVPDEIDIEQYDLDYDPHEINLYEYKEARKNRTRRIESMRNDKAGLYALMLQHISNESLDAIKLREGWGAADEDKDPLMLWILIEATHRVGIASRIPAVLKSESRRAYQSIGQSAYESIVSFKERFDDLLANYVEQGNPEMDEDDIAMDFYRALDNSRYAAFKTNLVNNINSGAIEQPETLNDMYTQASAYLIPTKHGHAGTHKTAFATTADRAYNGRGSKEGRGKKGDSKGGKSDGGKKNSTAAGSKGNSEGRDCWGCGTRGHLLRNCPEVEANGDAEADDGSVHMTIEYDSDQSDESCPDLYNDSSSDDSSSDDESDDEQDCISHSGDEDRIGQQQRIKYSAYLAGPKTTEWFEVLLDNQANTSVIHPRLLKNIRRTSKPVKVGGLSGHTINADMVGRLDGFFDVLAYHEGTANILCFSDVENRYEITYESRKSFTVHMDEYDLVFYRRNKIYVADMREWETYRRKGGAIAMHTSAYEDEQKPRTAAPSRNAAMVTTVAGNESKLTTRELRRVVEARAFIKVAGYPTLKEAINLVSDGNLLDCRVTAKDIRAAFAVDTVGGVTPAMAKGKTVNGHPPRLATDDSIKSEEVKQQLYTDVMHADDQRFLISVAEPLHLTLCTPVERESTHALGTALQEHLDTLREKGFNPIRVHCDPQSSLAALSGRFPGTEIDVQGAGDHLSIVDVKIRRVKEMMRCVHSDLPWPLPRPRIADLVAYAVTRINIRRTSAAVGNIAPRVALTGRKVRTARELGLGFGDYCEVADPKVVGEDLKSRQATANRTESCIALHPCSNEVGSWTFLNLATNKTVRRSRWKLMVTTPIVIARMTELAEKSSTTLPQIDPSTKSEALVLDTTAEDTSVVDSEESTPLLMNTDVQEDGSQEGELCDDDNESRDCEVLTGEENRLGGSDSSSSDSDTDGEDEPTSAQKPKGSSRPVNDEGDLDAPASLHTFHVSARKGLQEYGVKAYQAIMKEFEQLYKIKGAIAPVMPTSLKSDQWEKLIRSSLFLNPKHDAMGVFDKIKARLVANGKQQDRNLWTDRSSPTAMLESIMAVLVVAGHERRHLAGLDIGSAFLEADWIGEPVHIIIEKMLSTILVHEYPELKTYRRSDGTLVMRLLKALYGTLIASKLWFDKLTGVLRRLGFANNALDECVMNKTVGGNQLTVVIFVDDILATCRSESSLTWLIRALESEFDTVKGGIHEDLSYLGMHIKNKRHEGKVEVSMEGYEDELMKYAKVTGVRKTPATTNLFVIGDSKPLTPSALAHFHTLVAKLLYLSLRTRPMICVAVSYLTTRVTCGNEDDMDKLDRVLMYINGSEASVLTLSCAGSIRVEAFVDVAFGSHEDGKSQTGVLHKIGEATVMAKSQKQKMVSKDSTEAELVGLTDRVDAVLRLDEFMRLQGHDMIVPVIYQDNQSTITLVTKGGGKYRNVHLRVRQRRLMEKINNKELSIAYMPTGNMAADVLTKPLQGLLFLVMVLMLLNGDRASLTGVR